MIMGKTGCIIQARMTSTRLPGKVLRTIDHSNGKCVLDQVIERVKMSEYIDEIIIATTTNDDDDPIVEKAAEHGVGFFRGSESDVLSRYYNAAKKYGLDDVIRITSDCPFTDPAVLDDLISVYRSGDHQYASNCIRRTYPHGLDCEILKFDVLEWMFLNTEDKFYREHVTSYVTHHLDEFDIGSLEDDEDNSDIRITVDTVNDYLLTCVLVDLLKNTDDPISYKTIVEIYKDHPYLRDINGDILQKKKYETEKEELEAAAKLLRLQEMNRAAAILEGKI